MATPCTLVKPISPEDWRIQVSQTRISYTFTSGLASAKLFASLLVTPAYRHLNMDMYDCIAQGLVFRLPCKTVSREDAYTIFLDLFYGSQRLCFGEEGKEVYVCKRGFLEGETENMGKALMRALEAWKA